MPLQFPDDDRIDNTLAVQETYVHMTDEVMDLQIIENFLSAVERHYLRRSVEPFDRQAIRILLRDLENLPADRGENEFRGLEEGLRDAVSCWYAELERRNDEIEAYNLRRFCDSSGQNLERMVYSALTRFFRKIDRSLSNQSKFDLVITRLFSRVTDPPLRKMMIEREDLVEQLNALFEGWDYKTRPRRPAKHIVLVLAKIEDFTREAASFADFQELNKSNIFDRLRSFKGKLGDLFYEPSVTGALIECNVTVGNAFNKLLAKANEPLSARLTAEFDLAGAFHDTSPNSQVRIAEILAEIRTNGASETDPAGDQTRATLGEILELACDQGGDYSEKPSQRQRGGERTGVVVEEAAVKPEEKTQVTPSAQKRLEPLFFTLSQPVPENALLLGHLKRFKAIENLDLRDFIGSPEDPRDHLCRNVLGVILWVEELCDNELNQRREISSGLRDELQRIIGKSEDFSEELEYLVEEAEGESKTRLLTVSNKLLEARLKLKRSIVRFSRRSLANEEEEKDLAVAETASPATVYASPYDTGRPPTNRWLIAATLVISLLSGAIYYFDKQMSRVIPPPEGVEQLNVKRLPKGEHLQQAYRRHDKMLVTAKSSWVRMSIEEQRENLRELRDYPADIKVRTVIITDGMGRLLGDLSPEGTRIMEKLQIADNDPGK